MRTWTLRKIALFALECHKVTTPGHRLSVAFDQFRLVVKRVQMAAGTGTEYDQHIFCAGLHVGITGRKRLSGINPGANGRIIRQQAVCTQQGRQRNPAQSGSEIVEQVSSIQHATRIQRMHSERQLAFQRVTLQPRLRQADCVAQQQLLHALQFRPLHQDDV